MRQASAQPSIEIFPALTGDRHAPDDFSYRRLSRIEEFRECERLQSKVWGPEDVGQVSALVMITAQENGGLVLGAFAGDRLAGFVCSFPGCTEEGGLKQCSVLLAVDPELRHRGIGRRLKLLQREAMLGLGIDLITWTFDPLVRINADLNIRKLGCTCRRYIENCYGVFKGGLLNGGLPTDRLLAEWWIKDPRVAARCGAIAIAPPAPAPLINDVAIDPRTGSPAIRANRLDRDEPVLLIEIPDDFQAVKTVDIQLAGDWIGGLRELFAAYLARGYQVRHFGPVHHAAAWRWVYELRRKEEDVARELD